MKFLKALGAAVGTWVVVLWIGLGIGAILVGGYQNMRSAWSRWIAYAALIPGMWVFNRVWNK